METLNWYTVRLFIPCLLFSSAWMSSWLWQSSPWWACLTAILLACGISYSIFCCWWNPNKCEFDRPDVNLV